MQCVFAFLWLQHVLFRFTCSNQIHMSLPAQVLFWRFESWRAMYSILKCSFVLKLWNSHNCHCSTFQKKVKSSLLPSSLFWWWQRWCHNMLKLVHFLPLLLACLNPSFACWQQVDLWCMVVMLLILTCRCSFLCWLFEIMENTRMIRPKESNLTWHEVRF